jgi:hypothetical protein
MAKCTDFGGGKPLPGMDQEFVFRVSCLWRLVMKIREVKRRWFEVRFLSCWGPWLIRSFPEKNQLVSYQLS